MKSLKPTCDSPIYFAACVDEASNDIVHKCQYDVHICFFNEEKKEVSMRYLKSAFLHHSTARDLLKEFQTITSELDVRHNLIQISMDGPNMNWAFLRLLEESRSSPNTPNLLQIGSCGLHALHVAYKNGHAATNWELEQFLKSAYSLFKDSPARRGDFIEANDLKQDSAKFPHKFLRTSMVRKCTSDITNP